MTLTAVELNHDLHQRVSSRSVNEPVLYERLLECMQEQVADDNDEQDEEEGGVNKYEEGPI